MICNMPPPECAHCHGKWHLSSTCPTYMAEQDKLWEHLRTVKEELMGDSMDAEEERLQRTLKEQTTQFEEARDLAQRDYESVRDQLGAARIALAKTEREHAEVTKQLKARSEHLEKMSPSYELRVTQLADCRRNRETLLDALRDIKDTLEGVI